MTIQSDALSTSTPPNTGTHVTVLSKYHSDSKALMGMIDREWRSPQSYYYQPLRTLARESSMDSRLGAWYLWRLGTHRRHHRGANGDPRRDSASGRIRKRFRPIEQGKVRPPGFFAGGGAARLMRIGGGQHILSPTHMHPFTPVSNFEPHSHRAFRVFWTPQGRGTAAATW